MIRLDSGRHTLEATVVIGVIGLVALVLPRAFETTGEAIEAAGVREEIAAIRVALLDRVAHRELAGGALPDSANPLRWTGRSPAGYLGELDSPPAQRAVWYFDRRSDELVYRFRSGHETRYRLARNGALGPTGVMPDATK